MVERLALARARSALAAQAYMLPLKAGLTVGDWAARDTTRDRGLRLWLRSTPVSDKVRVYSDLSAEADVTLDPDGLARQIKSMLGDSAGESGEAVSAKDVDTAAAAWAPLSGRGAGAFSERGRSRKPPGWEDITLAGIELARRAASEDALSALQAQAGRLKVTPARLLRDFFATDPAISAGVAEGIARAARLRFDFAPDQVAVAEATLPLAELIRILVEVHSSQYRGDEYHTADFRQMALLTSVEDLRAGGLGQPPARERTQGEYRLVELDVPAWAGQTLEAIGRFVPAPNGESLPPAAQLELARFDGADQFRKRVEGLKVQGNVTVAELLALNPQLKPDVVLFLSGTRTAGPAIRAEQGVLEQKVELPLRKLWEIVRRGMQAVEVDPPATGAATSQPAPATLPTTGGNG